MNPEKMARHAEAFGDAHTKALQLSGAYNEVQCRECPHEHTCCDFIVACGPFEALGIINYLKVTLGEEGMRGMLQLIKWRAQQQTTHVKSYQDENGVMTDEDHTRMADDWYAKGEKCVFYDKGKSECSIYPVRPVSCRKVYGERDCRKEGVSTAAVNEWAEARRLTRIKIVQGGPLDQHRLMLDLITYMSGKVSIGFSKGERELLDQDPATLSADEHIWGPDGPPVELNPIDQEV